jgi:hypothetical protein
MEELQVVPAAVKEVPMRLVPVSRLVLCFSALAWAGPMCGDAAAQPSQPTLKSGISVWDTGQPSAEALAPAALAGNNAWTAIPLDRTADSFKGDAVLSNGRIVAVLRKQDTAVEVHAVKPEGAVARLRLRLQTAAGEPAVRLESVALVENGKGSASLEASFKTAKGGLLAAKFRIKRGDVSIQVEPGTGAGKLRVECPGRFVLLPDFFADDISIDAAKLPLSAVDLPSENFVLHLTANGDAIAMCVFENRQQDVKVTLAGEGDKRRITGSEIGFEGKKVWVSILEAPHIWHMRDLKSADTGQVLPLDWKMPFPAAWRVDFTRPNDLTDSWEMLLQEKKDGVYSKPSWLGSGDDTLPVTRRRWNTVLGTYPYPCWSDPAGQGYLQPLKSKVLQFQGPALIYPINRVKRTPLDAYTVVDVMRNTLGVGPCEHILDLEGQKSEYRGRATCGVRDALTPIYEKNQQKQKHAEVDRTLDEGLTFVKHIRGRITRYVEFGQKMRQYLAEQKKAHPELAEFIAEMDKLTQEIDKRVAARAAKIKTPEHVAQMNAEFRKNVLDYEGPDALQRCKEYTQALVVIGDNQDELSGECRWAIKTLRQRAGILMALDPRVAPIAAEIRARTQETLRNPANHEGARH